MKINTEYFQVPKTHEGAPAKALLPLDALRRSVLSCMLWEREAYEDGQEISARIAELVPHVSAREVHQLALEARHVMHLRHVPLLLMAVEAVTASSERLQSSQYAHALSTVIARADEPGEFLAIYAKLVGRTAKTLRGALKNQVKKGLALSLTQFSSYQLAKYDRKDAAVRIRDVMFLCHPKPKNADQVFHWRLLANQHMVSPDTWEVALSSGQDKKATWERLLSERKLGYLALLRNLRNMSQVGVDPELVRRAITERVGADRVFPFRYIAAARAVPQWEPWIDQALRDTIEEMQPFKGRTVILVDVSGSMGVSLSSKSDLTRMDAAAALASIIQGDRRVFTFSYGFIEVPPRFGMSGVDAIINSQAHGGTILGNAVATINQHVPHDRLIVITDEQSADRVPDPVCNQAYMINVASAQNGVGYGKWCHIDGFSENVLRYIQEIEQVEMRVAV